MSQQLIKNHHFSLNLPLMALTKSPGVWSWCGVGMQVLNPFSMALEPYWGSSFVGWNSLSPENRSQCHCPSIEPKRGASFPPVFWKFSMRPMLDLHLLEASSRLSGYTVAPRSFSDCLPTASNTFREKGVLSLTYMDDWLISICSLPSTESQSTWLNWSAIKPVITNQKEAKNDQ